MSDTPAFVQRIPDGEDRLRDVCDTCGFINYVNPKIVVGSVVTWEDRILFCRRAIEPRKGFWTLPAGFMEEAETAEEGAAREAMEEACAHIEIEGLLACYSVPRISQVQLMYRARLVDPVIAPGPESTEVALLTWDEIPWSEIAFPSVKWALEHFARWRDGTATAPFANPPGGVYR
ncbi:MAG: NUDIX hydrolase [Alphaproteobacteria bacterium]|nr:NUDIX hydrolase [Alphaproteobacteria bacterium]